MIGFAPIFQRIALANIGQATKTWISLVALGM